MADTFTDPHGCQWSRREILRSDNWVWETASKGCWVIVGSDANGAACILSAHLAPIEVAEYAVKQWRSSHG